MGLGVGVGLGLGVGVGVGVGEVNASPSKFPGFVESGTAGVEVVAFDAKAIHRPSLLITGRLFAISILMLKKLVPRARSISTLLVSVIWKMRRCAKSHRNISTLPSAFRGFSVAKFPLDSKTTKRPSPLVAPANDSAGEDVNWPITVLG